MVSLRSVRFIFHEYSNVLRQLRAVTIVAAPGYVFLIHSNYITGAAPVTVVLWG